MPAGPRTCQGFAHSALPRPEIGGGCSVLPGCKGDCCWRGRSPGFPQGRMRPGVGGSKLGWQEGEFLAEFGGQERGSPGLGGLGAWC